MIESTTDPYSYQNDETEILIELQLNMIMLVNQAAIQLG